MLNNKLIISSLRQLGLSADDCAVYMALLEGPASHLQVARKTGVNRTKVYRVAENLIRRGLIVEVTDDTGRELAANNPANLEIALTTAEEALKAQRQTYSETLPSLQELYNSGALPNAHDFIVNTYDGVDGFKQMLWNELRTKDQLLVLGGGSLQELIGNFRWAEKHRAKSLEAGYNIRELLNPHDKLGNFTENQEYIDKIYSNRHIATTTLPLKQQVAIYNDTVAIYDWHDDQKVGLEIVNEAYAETQRKIFEHYWELSA
jgi:predicted transcriptional regulator